VHIIVPWGEGHGGWEGPLGLKEKLAWMTSPSGKSFLHGHSSTVVTESFLVVLVRPSSHGLYVASLHVVHYPCLVLTSRFHVYFCQGLPRSLFEARLSVTRQLLCQPVLLSSFISVGVLLFLD
jgi:hypothetical protein